MWFINTEISMDPKGKCFCNSEMLLLFTVNKKALDFKDNNSPESNWSHESEQVSDEK